MSDVDSVVCVDKYGNPIVEPSELSLGQQTVYEIDDSDSSIETETVQLIAMPAREKDVLVHKHEEKDQDEEEQQDEEEGKNYGAKSPVSLAASLSAEDPDRRVEVIGPHKDDTAHSCLVDQLIIDIPSNSSSSSVNSDGGNVTEDMSDVIHGEDEEASKQKGGQPMKHHKADKTTMVTSLPIRSRVYARWSNGQYFWGTTTATSADDYYSVRILSPLCVIILHVNYLINH